MEVKLERIHTHTLITHTQKEKLTTKQWNKKFGNKKIYLKNENMKHFKQN